MSKNRLIQTIKDEITKSIENKLYSDGRVVINLHGFRLHYCPVYYSIIGPYIFTIDKITSVHPSGTEYNASVMALHKAISDEYGDECANQFSEMRDSYFDRAFTMVISSMLGNFEVGTELCKDLFNTNNIQLSLRYKLSQSGTYILEYKHIGDVVGIDDWYYHLFVISRGNKILPSDARWNTHMDLMKSDLSIFL